MISVMSPALPDPSSIAVSTPKAEPANGTYSVPGSTPELLAELKRDSDRLEQATPQEIIAWAVEKYFPKLTMATAFGPEGMAIIHMLAAIEPRVPVFNLDAGYQFQET